MSNITAVHPIFEPLLRSVRGGHMSSGVGYERDGCGALDPEHWTNRRPCDEPHYTVTCEVCDHPTSVYATERVDGMYVCQDCYERWTDPNNKKQFVRDPDVLTAFVEYMYELGAVDEFIRDGDSDYIYWLNKH